ncbi:proline-rich nuclear receptor coactivator 1 [Kryptolebias marmoratus]|uniref:Proline-rich nuclear receptor coactivator 1-like n=1 Tax=Kryptolebias marmoratus TaxID=37003 RepID=A0A3Q3AJ44_KRYMA|nr:proline-rich nuclear receptor coactivator 1 [Kryptolebias marmoratus]
MLDGTPANGDEAIIGDVENNNPVPGGKATKQALLAKKGGRKPLLHHQKAPRNCPNVRLSDHNNNITLLSSSTAQPGTHGPVSNQNLHHVKQGARKEVLKSKGGRSERAAIQPGSQPPRHLPRHDQINHNVNTRSHKPKQSQTPAGSPSSKKNDSRTPKKPSSSHLPHPQEQKKALLVFNSVKIVSSPPTKAEYFKDGEKTYAGAKFSEPPSPSVLPKPPSHWVGENGPQQSSQSREQMTVHLKSLLKVQD